MTREEQQRQKRKFLLASNLPQQIRGPLGRESGLTRGKGLGRKGWRQNSPLVNKEWNEEYTNTNLKYTYTHSTHHKIRSD
jgi:hypothetical protein